jgi:hypothetical protein
MLLVANVMQQINWLLKLIIVLLGLRAQKALFTPANYCINDFILIRFYKDSFFNKLINSTALDTVTKLFLLKKNLLLSPGAKKILIQEMNIRAEFF